jgi:hypothetical protein
MIHPIPLGQFPTGDASENVAEDHGRPACWEIADVDASDPEPPQPVHRLYTGTRGGRAGSEVAYQRVPRRTNLSGYRSRGMGQK